MEKFSKVELFQKRDEDHLRQKKRNGLIFFFSGLAVYLGLALTFFFIQTRATKTLYLTLEIILGILMALVAVYYFDVVFRSQRAALRLYALGSQAEKQEKTLVFLRSLSLQKRDDVVFEELVFREEDKEGKTIESHFFALPQTAHFEEGQRYCLSFYRDILTAYSAEK